MREFWAWTIILGGAVGFVALMAVVTRFAYWVSRKIEPERHIGKPPFYFRQVLWLRKK